MAIMVLPNDLTVPTQSIIRENYPELFDAHEQLKECMQRLLLTFQNRLYQSEETQAAHETISRLVDSIAATCASLDLKYDIDAKPYDVGHDNPARRGHVSVMVSQIDATLRELGELVTNVARCGVVVEAVSVFDTEISTLQMAIERYSSKVSELETRIRALSGDGDSSREDIDDLRQSASTITARQAKKSKACQASVKNKQKLLRSFTEGDLPISAHEFDRVFSHIVQSVVPRKATYVAHSPYLASRRRRRARLKLIATAGLPLAMLCGAIIAYFTLFRDETQDPPAVHPFIASTPQQVSSTIPHGEIPEKLADACRNKDPNSCRKVASSVQMEDPRANPYIRAFALRRACDMGDLQACGEFETIKDAVVRPYQFVLLESIDETVRKGDLDAVPRMGGEYSRLMCNLGSGSTCFEMGSFFLNSNQKDPRGLSLLREACDLEFQPACETLARN